MSPQSGGPREPFFGRDDDRDDPRRDDPRYEPERDAFDDGPLDQRDEAYEDDWREDRAAGPDDEYQRYPDDFYDEEDEGERRGLFQSGALKAAVAGAALILFAGVVWYAYSLGRGDLGDGQELPVIAGNTEPERVRPENPGGLSIPHQDKLVLNERGQGEEQVERLLPEPEQPQLPPREEASVEEELRAQSEIETQQLDEQATQQPAAEEAPGEAAAETGSEPAEAPVAQPEPEPAPEPEAEPEAPPAPPAAPQASPSEGSSAPGFVVGSPRGPFAVQFASVRSQERAVEEWDRLRSRFPELLGQSELAVQQVEIDGQGTFYRIQGGPFPNRTTAEDICAQLQAADQSCLVVAR